MLSRGDSFFADRTTTGAFLNSFLTNALPDYSALTPLKPGNRNGSLSLADCYVINRTTQQTHAFSIQSVIGLDCERQEGIFHCWVIFHFVNTAAFLHLLKAISSSK